MLYELSVKKKKWGLKTVGTEMAAIVKIKQGLALTAHCGLCSYTAGSHVESHISH